MTDTSEKAKSQQAAILRHLQKRGRIEMVEAWKFYGCAALRSRISELRKQGVEIETRMVSFTSLYGHPGKHAVTICGVLKKIWWRKAHCFRNRCIFVPRKRSHPVARIIKGNVTAPLGAGFVVYYLATYFARMPLQRPAPRGVFFFGQMADLKKSFTNISEVARQRLGITRDEYALCSYIAYRIADPRQRIAGWCCDTKEDIAAFVGVTRAGLYKMVARLIVEELIEAGGAVPFVWKVTAKWVDTENDCKQSLQDSVNKVDTDCKQSLHRTVNKVYTHNKVELDISKNELDESKNSAALPLSPPYQKVADIYPETFSLEAQQPGTTSPGGGAPGAIRVSITGPEHPNIAVNDIIEPKTDAPKTGRAKAKNPRSGTQDEIELATRVIEHLNQTAGRSFRVNTGENAKGIIARHREGFTEAELKQVIDFKAGTWGKDPAMYEHVNPVTLFRPANFERYLQAARAIAPKQPKTTHLTRSTINDFRGADYSEKQKF